MGTPGYDGITIQWFDSAADFEAFVAAPEYATVVAPDEQSFLDTDAFVWMITEEPVMTIDGSDVVSTATASGRDFEGKVASVTGGASGIGRASAELFAARGAKVVVADLDDAQGGAAVAAINALEGEAVFVRADVTEPDQVDAPSSVPRSSRSVDSTSRSTTPAFRAPTPR